MVWRDLPDELAAKDMPLSSALTVQVEANLDRCYEQSLVAPGSIGGTAGWTTSFGAVWDDWELHCPTGWRPPPIPLRVTREGEWRTVEVVLEAQTDQPVDIRAYLLPRLPASDEIDPADGIVGVDSYDEELAFNEATWSELKFSISPGEVHVLAGDGTVPGYSAPVAYLVFLVRPQAANCDVSIRAVSIGEVA